MKKYTHPDTRLLSAALFSLALLLAACSSDDTMNNKHRGGRCAGISFGIDRSADAPAMKSAAGNHERSYTMGNYVMRSATSGDTLCVSATVCDFDDIAPAAVTHASRGTLVTAANDMHNTFGVTACAHKGGTDSYYFFNEENLRNGDVSNAWTYASGNAYFWPGNSYTFDFYAYAPHSAAGVILANKGDLPAGAAPTLTYEVPEAEKQTDLLYAHAQSDGAQKTAPVPLTFSHICTAVQFVTGNEMQTVRITKITFRGIRDKGTFNPATETWTLNNTTNTFVLETDKSLDSDTPQGTPIAGDDNCFLMLPQTLPDGAEVEVDFYDARSNTNKNVTMSVAGHTWPQGKRVKYRISISPSYELHFTSEPEVQDAHYVIYPIKIKADKLPKGGWTLKSDNPENVTFVERFDSDDIKNIVDQGYWLKEHCGNSTLTSTTNGDIQIYVFLKENASQNDRKITLSLSPTNAANASAETFTFTQYCPAWNNGIGVERIQEKDYPWGFDWDSSMKITYKMPNNFITAIIHVLFTFFGDKTYVTQSGTVIRGDWTVTVDFSKVDKLNTATSNYDGLTNTWQLYNFNGVNDASSIMQQLESWGGVADKKLPTNPSEFAAWACAKKNPYKLNSKSQGGQTIYVPELLQSDMVWYLPAETEATNMIDNLDGDYWTSTAITDPGTTAYKYTVGGGTSSELRNKEIHVRAVRKK